MEHIEPTEPIESTEPIETTEPVVPTVPTEPSEPAAAAVRAVSGNRRRHRLPYPPASFLACPMFDPGAAPVVDPVPVPIFDPVAVPSGSLPPGPKMAGSVKSPAEEERELYDAIFGNPYFLPEAKCFYCKKVGMVRKKCPYCSITWYCSSECQGNHWRVHNLVCGPEGGMAKSTPASGAAGGSGA